jgi:hypothetical protein
VFFVGDSHQTPQMFVLELYALNMAIAAIIILPSLVPYCDTILHPSFWGYLNLSVWPLITTNPTRHLIPINSIVHSITIAAWTVKYNSHYEDPNGFGSGVYKFYHLERYSLRPQQQNV